MATNKDTRLMFENYTASKIQATPGDGQQAADNQAGYKERREEDYSEQEEDPHPGVSRLVDELSSTKTPEELRAKMHEINQADKIVAVDLLLHISKKHPDLLKRLKELV